MHISGGHKRRTYIEVGLYRPWVNSVSKIKGHSSEMGATVKDDLDGTIFAYDYTYETTCSMHHDLYMWTDHVT